MKHEIVSSRVNGAGGGGKQRQQQERQRRRTEGELSAFEQKSSVGCLAKEGLSTQLSASLPPQGEK